MPSVRRVWLGTKGIKELVKQYDIMAKDIQKYTESAHDYVVERAKAEYSGRLADADGVDVEWQSTGKSYRARIYNHDINAKFVEYGTGLNGVGTFPGGNPNPEGGTWNYNSGKMSSGTQTIIAANGKRIVSKYGTWAPYWSKNKNGIAVATGYTDSKTGEFHYLTCGQKAQAPMYLTVQDVKKNMPTWVRTSFAQHGIQLKEK